MVKVIRKFKLKRKRSVDAKQNKDIKVLKRAVKTLVKADQVKVRDNQYQTISNISTTVQGFPITDMAPWNSADPLAANALRMTSREGDSYLVRNYSYRGTLEIANNSVYGECIARIVVVHTPDSAQPVNFSDVFTSNRIHSYKKIKPPQKYDVLYDKSFSLQNTVQTPNGPLLPTSVEPFRKEFKINLNFRKKPVKVSFTIGDPLPQPIMGAITMYVWSNQPPPTAPDETRIQIRGQNRLRFIDN